MCTDIDRIAELAKEDPKRQFYSIAHLITVEKLYEAFRNLRRKASAGIDGVTYAEYTFGRCYSMRKGRGFLGTVPSKKRVQRICRAISDETRLNTVWQDSTIMVAKLNRIMTGWANYFCLGPVSNAYSVVDQHARMRLRRWLCDKHKESWPGYKRFPEASLNAEFGLVNLPRRTANLPWART